jgi:5-methylcytosine-specific restriction endonuclease McrA
MKEKSCKDCLEIKDTKEFYSQTKINSKGLEYIYYHPYCKPCTINRSEKWQMENQEQYHELKREYSREVRKTKERKEYEGARSKRNRENGMYRDWLRRNTHKTKEYTIKRKMHKKHIITENEWKQCLIFFDHSCAYCGIHIDEAKEKYKNTLHKDHFDNEGSNKIDNCVPACRSCNSSKGNKTFEEWYIEQDRIFYSDERKIKIYKWLQLIKINSQND